MHFSEVEMFRRYQTIFFSVSLKLFHPSDGYFFKFQIHKVRQQLINSQTKMFL